MADSSSGQEDADRELGVGSGLIVPDRHPNAPVPGAEIPTHYPRCFGCGEDVVGGLRMRFWAGEGLTVKAEFEIGEHHQGAPGLAHGGILAAAFDEALGGLNWLLLVPAVTGTLETRFRQPIQVGQTLFIECEITGVEGRKVFNRGVGRVGGPEGQIAVEASAVYIQVPLEHFRSHGRADEVERFANERAIAPGGPAAMNIAP